MWNFLFIFIAIIIIIGMDGVPLWKVRNKRALLVFGVTLCIGLGLLIYQNTGRMIPSPLLWIQSILSPITEKFYEIFK
ncbi:hypothetical protein ACSVDE_07490 [Pseudalkalibacillus sp. Hm43]|uniref:hypothetical protein n=1 Tax=Pseudalkalibacillus sp. Hm43 TaxID=3450742 RepID=UPI003F43BDAB